MNMRLFCNSLADWCRQAKIHWTFINKIEGPQLFSLYEIKYMGSNSTATQYTKREKGTYSLTKQSAKDLSSPATRRIGALGRYEPQRSVRPVAPGCSVKQAEQKAMLRAPPSSFINRATASFWYTELPRYNDPARQPCKFQIQQFPGFYMLQSRNTPKAPS